MEHKYIRSRAIEQGGNPKTVQSKAMPLPDNRPKSPRCLPAGKNEVVQGFFTVKGQKVNRVTADRIDGYLGQHHIHLADGFNDRVTDDQDHGEVYDWLHQNHVDTSIVGRVNGPEPVVKSIRDIFKEAGRQLNIPYDTWEMVIDLDLAGQYNEAVLSQNTRGFKTDMLRELKNGWEAWTSCFATSERLYHLLANVPVMSQSAGANEASDLERCMIDLSQQVASIGSENLCAVFRVNLGNADHSFTIVVQGRYCEVIQSFAGGNGESLAFNIKNGRHMTTVTAAHHLANLCKPKNERQASSQALFNGGVMQTGDGVDLWPTLPVSWSMSTMKQSLAIFGLVSNKIKENLGVLKYLGLHK